jgi:hypothetical protein
MARQVVIQIKRTTLYSISIDLDDYDEETEQAFEEQDPYLFSEFTDKESICDSQTEWEWD